MPEPQTQTQQFDYLGDMRKRYPGLSGKSDQDIWKYLGTPENFRKVYPKYGELDDYTIKYNIDRLSKAKPKAAPSAPTAKGGVPTPAVPSGAPSAPGTAAQAPPKAEPSRAQQVEQMATQASQAIESFKPQWADPRNIMKDPTWYGRSGRYFGGETIGLGKAGAQVMVGGAKLLYDIGNALDPMEAYKSGDAWGAVGKDVVGLGKGVKTGVESINEVLAAGWDTITGHPELHADPIKFGEAVGNAAMTVDGAAKLVGSLESGIAGMRAAETPVKGTAEFLGPGMEAMEAAKRAKPPKPPDAQTAVSKIKASPVTSALFRRKALGDTYLDQTPIQMSRDVKPAYDAIKKEIETQADSMSSQIDKKYPQGVISADDVKAKLEAGLAAEETTPKLKAAKGGKPVPVRHPVVQQMLLQVKAVSPGMWTFEQVRQLRSMVGRSLEYLEGPEKKVATQAYVDLTGRLAGTAKKFGLEKTWKQYDGLSRDFYKYYDNMVDDMKHAQSGKEVFGILKRDPAATSRLAHSLARYGLDYDKFMTRFNRGLKVLERQEATNRTAFYYANRVSGGLLVTAALKEAGVGYEATLGGFAFGLAVNQAVNITRALKLTGDMNWHIYDEMVLRGRMPPETAVFPEGEEPGAVPPEGTPPSPGSPPSAPTPPAPVPGGTPPAPEAEAAAKAAEPPKAKPKAKPPKPAGKTAYAGPERRATPRTVTQDIWAKNQIDYAREQLAKATDESEKNILRRRIEELQKDPTLAGAGEEMGRDIRAARAQAPSGLSEAQVERSIMSDPAKAKAYDVADRKGKDKMLVEEKRRMEAQPVTKVEEGARGKKTRAKKATATEPAQPASPAQQKYDRERVAAKRQEKGSTAYGGGGLEIAGGGIGSAAIEAQEAAKARVPSVTPNPQTWTSDECIQYMKTQYPEGLEAMQNILRDAKKGKIKITEEEILSGLRDYATVGMEENAAKARAEALIEEQEGRPLSESEEAIRKSQEKQD